MTVEHWWNDIDSEKPNYLDKYLLKCHIVYFISDMEWTEIELGTVH
jgi:hypothetical protein